MNYLIAHLIGDYIFQTDWMAEEKKKSHLGCLIHIATYILPFLFCGLAPWQILAIATQHFLQDRWGFVVWFMKIKGSGKFATAPMAPWSIIVTDNVLHICFIWAIIQGGKIIC